jgi:hypothetical protein
VDCRANDATPITSHAELAQIEARFSVVEAVAEFTDTVS